MRALVVEDSRAIRSIIAATVKELGFELIEAARGGEALERLAGAGKVDLVLMDWKLSEAEGLEFLAAVRDNQAWKETVILLLTTEAQVGQVGPALEAGANGYLTKPFTKHALRERLQLVGLSAV